jgi:hypothetical protein
MNTVRRGLGDAVNRMGFLSPHTDLDNSRVVLDEFSHGFTTKAPYSGEVADAVVLFERCIIKRHEGPYRAVKDSARRLGVTGLGLARIRIDRDSRSISHFEFIGVGRASCS